jgi:HK97 family phage major capsid protein
MSDAIRTLEREIAKHADAVKLAFDLKSPEQMSSTEVDDIRAHNKQIEQHELRLQELKELDGMKQRAGDRSSFAHETVTNPGNPASGFKGRGVGETFVKSKEWNDYLGRFPNGQIPSSFKGIQVGPISIGSVLTKADLITGAEHDGSSAGTMVTPDRQAGVVRLPYAPIGILDVISRRTTNSDLVEFVRQLTNADGASPVDEATSPGDGEKPQSEITFEVVPSPVINFAHFIAVTKRALADAGQVRGIIDDELRHGLLDKLVDGIINGSGTPNFDGLVGFSGLSTQSFDTDILTTSRKARTKVRTDGRATPNAYLMSPATWESLDLTKGGLDQYYFGGPLVMGTPRLWGLPVVEEEKVPDEKFYVGDFRQLVLWDRQQATISVTDSHDDWFIRNIVAILAEQRAAFGIQRPAAIVECESEGSGSGS